MIKILQISNKAPFPANDGSSIAIYNMALGLISNGVELDLLCINTKKHFKPDEGVDIKFKQATNYKSVFVNTDTNLFSAFKNLFSNQSYFVSRFYNDEFNEELIKKLKSKTFDIVQIEGIFMCVYIDTIKQFTNAKIVVRTHNVEHKIWERHIKTEKNSLKKIYLQIQNNRLCKFELNMLNRVDAAVTISPDDEQTFKQLNIKCKLFTNTTGVDFSNYQLKNNTQFENNSIFYLASMDWLPNQEAIDWFLENCWTNISKQNPLIKLVIAGRNMPTKYKNIINKQVYVLENVIDVNAFYSTYNILIVPLLSGSGVRIKIIEGMAYGKPIISTTIGAEGINAVNNKEIIIANSATDFTNAILSLINDKTKQLEISENAKSFALKNFDNKQITNKLLNFYNQLLNV